MGALFALVAAGFFLFMGIIYGTLVGGIVGYVVDWVFPFVNVTLNKLAGTTLTAFELGATLGFFGSFFRSSLSVKNKE